MNIRDSYLKLSPEIRDAIDNNRSVVALETTLVSHGLPYPENIELAQDLENIIRNSGAVPAMIALIDGYIKIGLTADELLKIGDKSSKASVMKVSRKDIAYAIAMKKLGATTVSGTMICAAMAGIKVFATGGIGGVHRDANLTFDISADLQELAQTNVAVVCSGAKSILDIHKTLELLETFGVPVIGYKTERFPEFYSRDSGQLLEHSVPNAETAAKLLHTKWDLGLNGGLVIANPIPSEAALDASMIEALIEKALQKAGKEKVAGKKVTPFLLRELSEISQGKTLKANLALLKDNARAAAEIALAYSRLKGVLV